MEKFRGSAVRLSRSLVERTFGCCIQVEWFWLLLLAISERHRVEGVGFFVELERADDFALNQVLKKVADCFANGLLFDAADVFEAAFFEDIDESDDWSQLFIVSDAFNDAAQSVMFDGDVQRSVVLIGHVEKFVRERERLMIF